MNVLEQELADLVKASAGIDGFSLTEPLVYCGLTSLSALRLATELYKKFGISVDMNSFVKTATLQGIENLVLSSLLSGQKSSGPAAAAAAAGPVPMTFQQAGLYFECMKAPMRLSTTCLWSGPCPLTWIPGRLPRPSRKLSTAIRP